MTSLWPHQSRRWSHWGASNTPVLLYLCHTQCRTLWSLAPRQTSHIHSHMTYSTGPGEEDQKELSSSVSQSFTWYNRQKTTTTTTTKYVLWQDIHRRCKWVSDVPHWFGLPGAINIIYLYKIGLKLYICFNLTSFVLLTVHNCVKNSKIGNF